MKNILISGAEISEGTTIFFPNNSARPEEYIDAFSLSEREERLIKELAGSKRIVTVEDCPEIHPIR
jgi:type IV secretory pathway VirB4 component